MDCHAIFDAGWRKEKDKDKIEKIPKKWILHDNILSDIQPFGFVATRIKIFLKHEAIFTTWRELEIDHTKRSQKLPRRQVYDNGSVVIMNPDKMDQTLTIFKQE